MTTMLDVIAEWEANDATRTNVGTFIGIAGPTGSGKTWSALELATGLTPPGETFVVLDTEHERALMYADDFKFKHVPFNPPFSSDRYAAAIDYQIRKGFKVIVVDSASHEYIGEGGMHDEHDRILDEMVKRSGRDAPEWKIRDALTWPAWNAPKRAHKKFKANLTRLPPGHHIILCFRAEQKTEMVTDQKTGRKEVRQKEGPTGRDGWFPICDAALPYEMTLSFLVLADKPGVPLPIKAIPSRLRSMFPLDKPLIRESGRLLAEWARGGAVSAAPVGKSEVLAVVKRELATLKTPAQRQAVCKDVFGVASWADVEALPLDTLKAATYPAEGANISRLEGTVITAKESAA